MADGDTDGDVQAAVQVQEWTKRRRKIEFLGEVPESVDSAAVLDRAECK